MNSRTLFIFTLIFATIVHSTHAGEIHTAKDEITPLLEEMLDASNSYNTEHYMEAFHNDSSLLYVFNGRIINGWDDLRTLHLNLWKKENTNILFKHLGKPEINQVSANIATVLETITVVHIQDDGNVIIEFVISSVWKKFPEGWKIITMHKTANRK